jgi:predicted O-methyltransferase YrrM
MATIEVTAEAQERLIERLLARLPLFDEAPTGRISWPAFRDLSDKVFAGFAVEWTSLSLTMCRTLFALACCGRPRAVLVLGSHVGLAGAFLLRDRTDARCNPPVECFVGIDPDEAATAVARRNCALLGHGARASILATTGQQYLAAPERRFDLLLIDIDDPATGKADYAELLQLALPHLEPGALVLAHDPLVARFGPDMDIFHDWIAADPRLTGPWILPVDDCGLTVAARLPY